MFSDFNINKYKHINYPSDFSLKTLNEIKSLQTQKLDTSFANRYDDIDKAFKQLFKNKTRTYPAALVNELIEKSQPIILRIKNYHDRPRPNELAKKFDIDLSYYKMKSAQTPAFPSGHSAQSKLISLVLSDMFPEMSNEFERVADNISKSRIIARVHYKSDKDVGEKLGKDLYNHLKSA